jgi:hypothetical protein
MPVAEFFICPDLDPICLLVDGRQVNVAGGRSAETTAVMKT